jgi:hypothetical protein
MYEVVVSDVGSMYLGYDSSEAHKTFSHCMVDSIRGEGEAGYRTVQLIQDGVKVDTFVPDME